MSLQSHIRSLEERHRALDDELEGLRNAPSVPDDALSDLKRRKLALKDEINRLEQTRH